MESEGTVGRAVMVSKFCPLSVLARRDVHDVRFGYVRNPDAYGCARVFPAHSAPPLGGVPKQVLQRRGLQIRALRYSRNPSYVNSCKRVNKNALN